GVDLWPAGHLPGDRVHDHHHGDEALLPEDAPVLERRLGHAADHLAVHIHVAAGHRSRDPSHAVDQVDDHTVLGDRDPVGGYARTERDLGIGLQVAVLA